MLWPDNKSKKNSIYIPILITHIICVCIFFYAQTGNAAQIDSSFVSPEFLNDGGAINDIDDQSDGKIIIVGDFEYWDGFERRNIVRLNLDGSVDQSFSPNVSKPIEAIELQGDGKILIASSSFTVNGVARQGIARLNGNGTLDMSFEAPATLLFEDNGQARVRGIKSLSSGHVLIVGAQLRNSDGRFSILHKLTPSGEYDSSFLAPATCFVCSASVIQVNQSNQVYVGGSFSVPLGSSGRTNHSLARFNQNGTIDEGFVSPLVRSSLSINSLTVESESVLIGGRFTVESGDESLVRLSLEGEIDPDFRFDTGGFEFVSSISKDQLGNILVGGSFSSVNGETPINPDPFPLFSLVKINDEGALDNDFSSLFSKPAAPRINKVLSLPNQNFITINIAGRNEAARVRKYDAEGRLDSNYVNRGRMESSSGVEITSVELLSDDVMLVAGNFTRVNDVTSIDVVRLTKEGLVDSSFTSPYQDSSAESILVKKSKVDEIHIDQDGHYFLVSNTQVPNLKIVKTNANGQLSPDFRVTSTGGFLRIAVQADNKVLLASDNAGFLVNDTAPNTSILRLTENGDLDGTFNLNITGTIQGVITTVDSEFYLAGQFRFSGDSRKYELARFDSDGSLDSDFQPIENSEGSIKTLAQLSEGSIVIAGANNFASPGSSTALGFARYSEFGAFSPTYNQIEEVFRSLVQVEPLCDGEALIAAEQNGRITLGESLSSDFILLSSTGVPTQGLAFEEFRGFRLAGPVKVFRNGDYIVPVKKADSSTISLLRFSDTSVSSQSCRDRDDESFCVPIKTMAGSLAVICL